MAGDFDCNSGIGAAVGREAVRSKQKERRFWRWIVVCLWHTNALLIKIPIGSSLTKGSQIVFVTHYKFEENDQLMRE